MSRRIEIELTSSRPDGSWTWRAAGAKLPKGDLDGSLLFEGAKAGDVVRADADFMLDGIVILSVLAPKGARKEPERIEVVGTPRKDDDQLVTTTLAPKQKREDRGDRRPRRDGDGPRPGRDGDSRPPRERRPRPEGETATTERRERKPRPPRPERPAPEPKPKAKRLRAGRVHRDAVLAGLPEEQKPIAEQLLRGGIPAVRTAVEKQNQDNIAAGRPEISPAPLLALAEQLMPALRVADWRDKAEAALAGASEIDLRDLRSVVVGADDSARDEETRELATALKAALAERVEAEHTAWIEEVRETLAAGRTVRALRVSSRPPKAGTPFPAELGTALAAAASASLTAETAPDRYATVLDALAYAPVRSQVVPQGIPAEPGEALISAVTKLASRIPAIAALFGIEAKAPTKPSRSRGRVGSSSAKPLPPKPPVSSAPSEAEDALAGAVAVEVTDVEVTETIEIITDGETTVVVDVTDVEIVETVEIITAEADVVIVDVTEIEVTETTIIEADGTETTITETEVIETEIIELTEPVEVDQLDSSGEAGSEA
ncbi:MAG: hypothetical protein F2520_05020 [Actinobacteria bacterium]|uniref:Unannotated protein n=1 Tax=freshwater metagenome TaxID=449393 RepID=A0A6J5YFJ0_9ZZZZ|nr:hypothetical protein [Actinomycetota bacterium]MTA77603.1 hypothetical protein [Actinomycetota bacterium]